MSKAYKIVLGILVLFIGTLYFLESRIPNLVDWSETYSTRDKIPFGTYVFYEHIKNKAEVQPIRKSPYEFLSDTTVSGTYIIINDYEDMGETAQKEVLEWVSKGNTFFVSSLYSRFFKDDSLKMDYGYTRLDKKIINHPIYNFSNPKLQAIEGYTYDRDAGMRYFSSFDTINDTALGTVQLIDSQSNQNLEEINFIEIPYGKGRLLLHSSPKAFTNYFLLKKQNHEYAERILAYFDLDKPIYYDVSYDVNYGEGEGYISSPLYVILENKYLKRSYYWVLIGVVLFILFEGKRKQKVIPVIKPPQNRSYEFIQTISGLYWKEKNHTHIAHKQIKQFIDFLKKDWRISLQSVNHDKIVQLSDMSGLSEDEVKALIQLIKRLQTKTSVEKAELQELHNRIYNFKRDL